MPEPPTTPDPDPDPPSFCPHAIEYGRRVEEGSRTIRCGRCGAPVAHLAFPYVAPKEED